MGKPKRVLIVDDEEHVLFVLGDTLSKLGDRVQVVPARSGAEALERIREAPFDVVVTDLRMPDLDGIDLTRKIGTLCPGSRVIWITAYSSPSVLTEAARLAVYSCLDKPLHIKEIRQIVMEALEEVGPRGNSTAEDSSPAGLAE